ncbi:MAG: NAD-dependent epimerase/dehydratase family protein [Planctomycetia bacterium]|nr:NAD-dependent epimerase/dehydratase family protein [Planctomycetia bacterium]
MSRSRVLITGGAGFIGSHLADLFLSRDWDVVVMDNLLTGDLKNIEHLIGKPEFQFFKQDVTEYIHVSGKIDAILHFASPASPIDYQEYPIQTLKVGSLGTHKALGLARSCGAKFLLASTSEVYGDPQIHPQPESYWGNVNPIGVRGVYDEAKRFAEAMTLAYHRAHGVDTRIVRIFNTYGSRMRLNDGRALPNFVCQAIRGEALTVYGDGAQTRSFCHVSDLIEGIWKLLHVDTHDPVNIGNPNEIPITEFARKVLSATGSSSAIKNHPLPEDDPQVRQPDISRAREILGWEPAVSLEEGLRMTVPYLEEKIRQLGNETLSVPE